MNSKKILIVDDSADTVDLLRKRLRHEGYDTAEAYDGEEGLRRVKEYEPDLIVLDVLMPKMDGFQVCRELKYDEKNQYIPILILTAKGDIESKIKGLEAGADDYLPKPFEYKELSARVRSLLSKQEAREKMAEERKIEAVGHVIDQLSHEIRNPLVSIGGFAKRVYKSLPDGDINKKYMETIIQDVARLEKMTEKLIELKSIDVCYIENADINKIITETLGTFEGEIKDKGIDVTVELADRPALVSADTEQIKRALGNIVRNSIEALEDQVRKLTIRTSASDDYVLVEVSDSGKGISRDKLKEIFDPFFTSKVYGPGLGLTLALKIIQAHRGTISVESEPGKGTTFTIRLPARRW